MPITGALTLVLSMLAAPPQASRRPTADQRELASYTLTMDAVGKVTRAITSIFAEAKKQDPFAEMMNISQEMNALKQKDPQTAADQKKIEELSAKLQDVAAQTPTTMTSSETESIDDIVRDLEKKPIVVAAIRKEGLTTREYTKCYLELLAASFDAPQLKAGILSTRPEDVSPANIKFVEEHDAELRKLLPLWVNSR